MEKIIISELKGERENNSDMNMSDQQINDLAQDIYTKIITL